MMMLNLGQPTINQERAWLSPNIWIGPSILAAILLVELLLGLVTTDATIAHTMVEAKEIGIALFGPYVLAVELASMLLLAGLVGAFHLARNSAMTVMMQAIPLEHGLILATILFLLGLVGVLTRRNLVFVLMSLEIMLNAAGLAFVVGASRWGEADGQVMFLMILSLAAAEVAIGLGLVLQLFLISIKLWI